MLTTTFEFIVDFLCACAGGALVWHFKATFQAWWHGAEKYAAIAASDAQKAQAALAAAKAAVTTVKP